MRRRRRKKRRRIVVVLFVVAIIIFAGVNYINTRSYLVTECASGKECMSKGADKQQLPASLAKLFVIEYATTLTKLDDIVSVNQEALLLTKLGSSVAGIEAKEYSVRNLYAAMLVPSGNDAAYALAEYCGGILEPTAEKGKERVEIFMENLNHYLEKNGLKNTVLYDPSGFDMEAKTTVSDLTKVTQQLLKKKWFRKIISQNTYHATLPDGSVQVWGNTNEFLNPSSNYYDENMKGVKTGTLKDAYNLIVLYEKDGIEYLICSLGSKSDEARYEDVKELVKMIE